VPPAGIEVTGEDWADAHALSLGYILCGAAGEFFTRGGQRDIDESFLVMMNAYHGDLDFHFPDLATAMIWEALVDTAEPSGIAAGGRQWMPGEAYRLRGHSFALFTNRAPESPPGRAAMPVTAEQLEFGETLLNIDMSGAVDPAHGEGELAPEDC